MADEPEAAPPADGPAEDGLSARDRRAQRHRDAERRAIPKKAVKAAAMVAAIVIVAAGGVWAFQLLPSVDNEMVHWHSGFRVFVGQEEILYNQCPFDLSPCGPYPGTGYARAHLHVKEPYPILHQEGKGAKNLALKDVFEHALKLDATESKFTFDSDVHAGRVVENNATNTWQLWVNHCLDGPDNWRHEAPILEYHPRQHDRMLIAYSDQTTREGLQPLMNQVPTDQQITEVTKDKC